MRLAHYDPTVSCLSLRWAALALLEACRSLILAPKNKRDRAIVVCEDLICSMKMSQKMIAMAKTLLLLIL